MSALNQQHFQDPTKAREWLEALLWPKGAVCPHCGVIGGHYLAVAGGPAGASDSRPSVNPANPERFSVGGAAEER